MKSSWETHKGKKIFFARYDHLPIDEYRAEIVAVEQELFQQPKSSVMLLVDTSGTLLSPEVLNLAKNTALKCKPYLSKIAILGMGGARKTLLDIVSKFAGITLSGFDSVEQAKDFLAQ